MLLSQIKTDKDNSLNYMERLVNAGSKSGFSSIHTSSKETNPFTSDGFNVKIFVPYATQKVERYGDIPNFCDLYAGDEFIFLHPDWLQLPLIKTDSLGTIYDGIRVIPTSSVRTVRVPNQKYYIKLCYPGKIGRIERDLKYPHLISGIEITDLLFHMSEQNCSKFFSFMPEIGGKLYETSISLGYIIREILSDDYEYILIPAFSLFSTDTITPNDPLILTQIMNNKRDKISFLLNDICIPLIDIFFDCAFKEGLIPEMHSQNILIAFDSEFNVKKILLRDLESVDKDVSIRKKLGLSAFRSYPHKCIVQEDEYYLIRHSFMYDYKLCEYLLDPLIECSSLTNDDKMDIKEKIRIHAKMRICEWGEPFFPLDNCWYKYPNTEIDRSTSKRPFLAFESPSYR